MITIITGTPGAGKTLYAVTKLLRKLLGSVFEVKGDDGVLVQRPRRVFTNIKGLLLDHELIGPGGTWTQQKKAGSPTELEWVFSGPGQGLRDWHLWAQPGDVIFYDEVQEVWKPRANGSAVPPDIGALETHRHMGVDFVLITQGIMLTERNLSMLCGRHLHVRRVGNMPFAIVYEWDNASRTLLYSKAMAKEKWWYDRGGYKLYKSAELHTKSPRRLPAVLFVLLFAIVAVGALSPWIYSRYGERFGWTKPIALAGAEKAAVRGAGKVEGAAAAVVAKAEAAVEKVDKFLGCAATATRCSCFNADGALVDKGPGFCKIHTEGMAGPPIALDKLVIPEQETHQRALAGSNSDAELLAFVGARADAQGRLAALANAPAPLQSKTPERSAGTHQAASR